MIIISPYLHYRNAKAHVDTLLNLIFNESQYKLLDWLTIKINIKDIYNQKMSKMEVSFAKRYTFTQGEVSIGIYVGNFLKSSIKEQNLDLG